MVKLRNSGFTLIEVLLVLFTITLFSLVFIPSKVEFENHLINPITCQLYAMSHKDKCVFINDLSFNENGNINKAQTRIIFNKECVFQLGMGRFRCE